MLDSFVINGLTLSSPYFCINGYLIAYVFSVHIPNLKYRT